MRSTDWWRHGGGSVLTWTWNRWRCSAASPGWPVTSTARAGFAFAEHQLEPWEFDVLTSLRRAGDPYQLSPGQLLTQTLVTSGTMTNRIDRLAKKGLVERLPDPTDRRGVLVRLTVEGQDRADQALAGLLAQERAILAEPPARSAGSWPGCYAS